MVLMTPPPPPPTHTHTHTHTQQSWAGVMTLHSTLKSWQVWISITALCVYWKGAWCDQMSLNAL